ncbi:MAG TPA: carbonic anhydrase [Thermoanaerobaculia bacterium]|nr:carbonic anhydrase [Thermoanaerobaculia bacterium]
MKTLQDLLRRNREWSEGLRARTPDFFERLCGIQRPEFLWIGCSDSRVPANEIIGMAPGELFVHRNVANLVVGGDANCMSVVQYAVEVLQVRRLIVCGHYGCGGVRAVVEPLPSVGGMMHVDRWLMPLRHVAAAHAAELQAIGDIDKRADRLCELNVLEQASKLRQSDVVRGRGDITVYALIYDLHDGLLRVLSDHHP